MSSGRAKKYRRTIRKEADRIFQQAIEDAQQMPLRDRMKMGLELAWLIIRGNR